jgi:hypothetical protein
MCRVRSLEYLRRHSRSYRRILRWNRESVPATFDGHRNIQLYAGSSQRMDAVATEL